MRARTFVWGVVLALWARSLPGLAAVWIASRANEVRW